MTPGHDHRGLTSRRRWLERACASACAVPLGSCASNLPDDQRLTASDVRMPPAIHGRGFKLVQNWDFANTIRNLRELREAFYTRYIYNFGQLDKLNDEWQRYRDNSNHVFEGGVLALVARASVGMAPGLIESGMLRSKWSGQYGYFECEMKVPSGRGLWPAFWLNPQDGIWPPEIDIVEIVNNGRDSTHNSFHFNHHADKKLKFATTHSKLDRNQTYRPGFDYVDDFHSFAVDWTVDHVRHYVDDVLVIERQFRWTHADGSDAGPAHVLLNLAVGGAWPGAPSPDVFPARLLVRHIRVWQA